MRISDWSSDVCSSDLCDFVEIKRAAMPLLQQSGPHQSIAVLNTEQFFFDSLRRHPGGRYDYEGCIMPSAPAMKHARSHFLSAAGGAGNQNTTPCSGQIGSASCRERVCQYV